MKTKMGGSAELIDEPTAETDSSFILPPSSLSVCLVSGGMDSCVTAAIAAKENAELAFLHVTYGQRTAVRERRAFDELANHFGVTKRLVASINYLKDIGGSSLTDQNMPVREANLGSKA